MSSCAIIPSPAKPTPGGRLSLILVFRAAAFKSLTPLLSAKSALRCIAVLAIRLRCRTTVGLPMVDVGMLEAVSFRPVMGRESAGEVEVSFEAEESVDVSEAIDALLLCIRKYPFRELSPLLSLTGVFPLPVTPCERYPSSLSSKRISSATKPILGETPCLRSLTCA